MQTKIKSEIVKIWLEIADHGKKKNFDALKEAKEKLEIARHQNFNKCSFPGCKTAIARNAKMCKMHSLLTSPRQRKKRPSPEEALAKIQTYDSATVLA